ncbi:MAG: hypothetical protein H0U10_12580, partial [Chloroflexia bacterium]|nr:hypothetical protein [Chloroflexia bacterium]
MDQTVGAGHWPKTFIIGGMGALSWRGHAQEFFDAATVLLNAINRNEVEDYRLANPALYLYRHSLELLLKDILKEEIDAKKLHTHDLVMLAQKLETYVQERYRSALPRWIAERLVELGSFDPRSTAFRYGENYDKRARRHMPVGGEV